MTVALRAGMVLPHTLIPTLQAVYIKHIQLFAHSSHLNKLVSKKEKTCSRHLKCQNKELEHKEGSILGAELALLGKTPSKHLPSGRGLLTWLPICQVVRGQDSTVQHGASPDLPGDEKSHQKMTQGSTKAVAVEK